MEEKFLLLNKFYVDTGKHGQMDFMVMFQDRGFFSVTYITYTNLYLSLRVPDYIGV